MSQSRPRPSTVASMSKPLIMPNSPTEQAQARPLWAMGIALQVLLTVVTVALTWLNKEPLCRAALVPLLLLSFVPYLLAVGCARRLTPAVTLRGIIVFAIFYRVTLWFAPTVLSNEVHRYLWDGRVQAFGANPYVMAPKDAVNSPKLGGLAAELLSRVGSPHIPAADQPLSELIFRAAAAIWPRDPGLLKAFFLGMDLAVVWVLIRLLRLRELGENAVIIYAWCPLPILEFAANGHVLPVAMFLALVGIYLATPQPPTRRWAGSFEQVLAALSAGGAVVTHLLALPLLPLIVRRIKMRFRLLIALVVAVFYLPFIGAGGHLFDGVRHYIGAWRFNDSVFAALAALCGSAWTPAWAGNIPLEFALPKLIALIAWLIVLLAMFVARVNNLRSLYILSGALLLLSPAVYPWHVAWLIPFLCFYPNPGWMLFSATVLLSYAAGSPQLRGLDVPYLKWIEYAPVLLALIWGHAARYVTPAQGPAATPTRR